MTYKTCFLNICFLAVGHSLQVGHDLSRLVERCSDALAATLAPVTWLSIADRTDGHSTAGYLDGRALDADGLDLQILVVSPRFSSCSLLERQRLVNTAIGPELKSGKVHSVQMRCWTPAQWQGQGMPKAFAAAPCTAPTNRLGFGGSYEGQQEGRSRKQDGRPNRVDSPYGDLMPSVAYGPDRRAAAAPTPPPPTAPASHHDGKGFGGGEATRDPAPRRMDPNDPRSKQTAIHQAESFCEYLAKRQV